MNRRGLIFRLILTDALVAAVSWLAFHREFFEAAPLEWELHFALGDGLPGFLVMAPHEALANELRVRCEHW